VGPVAFATAWVATGASMPGYSPVRDAISRLAATDAPHRGWMTAGFLAYGVGVSAFAVVDMRRTVPGAAWVATAVGGLATVGAALTPLGPGQSDPAHWAFAATGYLGVAVAPLLALPRTRWTLAAGGLAAMCLVATTLGDDTSGLFQRAGLTTAHAWIVASALGMGRRAEAPGRR
jgi:hypothetical protein